MASDFKHHNYSFKSAGELGCQMVFCRGCGKEIHETAMSCPHCGAIQYITAKTPQNQAGTLWLPVPSLIPGIKGKRMSNAMVFCRGCGKELHESAIACPHCGALQVKAKTGKSKVTAGVLAILLGGIGLHKFYLGAWGWGIIYILFVWTYIPAIISLVEGIRYLMLSEEDFTRKASEMNGAFSFLW